MNKNSSKENQDSLVSAKIKAFGKLVYAMPVLWLLLLLGSGCGDSSSNRHTPAGKGIDHRKPLSWGHEQTIYVFADDRVWHYAEKPLRETLERYYWTTENEQYFTIKRAAFKDIDHFFRFRNLLFLAHLDSQQEVSRYVKERLTANVLDSVKENGVGLFARDNLWANRQYVVFMLGDTEVNLLRYNILEANTLFEMFRSKLFSYVEQRVYGLDVHKPVFFRNLPWSMKIPQNYTVYKRDDGGGLLSLLARRKDQPDRYLSVYYEDMDENMVDFQWAYDTRSKIAWDYYDEDEFTRSDTRTEIVQFAGYSAIKFSGRWQNRKYAVGGSFQSFGFYDEANKRAWFVDNSVFYPQGDKLPALIELEVISRSFSVKPD